MNIEELREYCMVKPFTEETFPFGEDTLVFKVMGKAFLLCSLSSSPLQFNVKCQPEKALELREQYGFVQPGYHMNKKHWNTIVCESKAAKKLLTQWIDDSYELVVAGVPKIKKQKKE